jgi:hypothetical protein
VENATKKLQIKDARRILVLGAPDEARAELEASDLDSQLRFSSDYSLPGDFDGEVDCILAFLFSRENIAALAAGIQAVGADGSDDPLLWFAYPKGSSKRYSADFNRDSGWDPVLDLGFEGVRQIAFDEDWSLLRFRHRSKISKYTRKSEIGRS